MSIGIFRFRSATLSKPEEQVDEKPEKRDARNEDPGNFDHHGTEIFLRRIYHGPDGPKEKRDAQ